MTVPQGGGWTLRYSRPAEKDISRLDPPIRRRILNALGQLAEDPGSGRGLRKLSGRSESRLRVGDWRVILDVAAGRREIYVHRVLPRGRAYDR
jgi:mRNA interferase RelE/StbE